MYEMCALAPPFNATSLHQLAQRIVAGRFDKLPSKYSAQLNALVGALLTKDPRRRPSINEVLKMPIIARRISNFLEDDLFKDEFSHTLLHNKDVFREFQRRQQLSDEESKKR